VLITIIWLSTKIKLTNISQYSKYDIWVEFGFVYL
jgi:hypothetical protein